MPQGYACLDQQFKAEGWKVGSVLYGAELPEQLAGIALAVARGEYDDLRIIPAFVAISGGGLVPDREDVHILYVKTRPGHKHHVLSPNLLCKDTGTGEYKLIQL